MLEVTQKLEWRNMAKNSLLARLKIFNQSDYRATRLFVASILSLMYLT